MVVQIRLLVCNAELILNNFLKLFTIADFYLSVHIGNNSIPKTDTNYTSGIVVHECAVSRVRNSHSTKCNITFEQDSCLPTSANLVCNKININMFIISRFFTHWNNNLDWYLF